jgi:hypothetical protein
MTASSEASIEFWVASARKQGQMIPPCSSSIWARIMSENRVSALKPNESAREASKLQGQPSTRRLMNGSGRLNTDYIDVYWVHAWDFMTQVEAGHIRARLERRGPCWEILNALTCVFSVWCNDPDRSMTFVTYVSPKNGW